MTLLVIGILLLVWALVAAIVVALCVASAEGDDVPGELRTARRGRFGRGTPGPLTFR